MLLALLVLPSPAMRAEDGFDHSEECVILLHGLFRSPMAMKPLEWYLEYHGFYAVNQGYPSLLFPIEELADMAVSDAVDACHAAGRQRLHFVTHSLGGILVRQFSREHALAGLERVVMLGPPNQGSQVADFYTDLAFIEWLKPPAMEQLGTGTDSVPLSLGPVKFSLGIIAGTRRDSTLLPGFPDTTSDGTVSVEEARVAGMREMLEMPVTHTFMIWHPAVMAQVLSFLEHGRFSR